jgi:uncharacterized protein (TIGR03437 family)
MTLRTANSGKVLLRAIGLVLALVCGLSGQTLSVNNAALRFTTTVGAAALPPAQSVSVQSAPTGLGFTVGITGPSPHFGGWLLVSANSGRTPLTLSLQPNPTGLPAGTYTATVTLTGTTGTPTPTATVAVTLVVGTPPPTITVSPSALVFNYVTGEPVSGNANLASTFILSNTGAATAASLSLQSSPWLRVAPTGNITLAGLFNSIAVSVDPTGLSPRTYSANITIRSSTAANPTLTLPVTLNVLAAAPSIRNTWPLGVIQQSPTSTVTLNGRSFFANTTVAMTGFTPEATITVSDGTNSASESFYLPVYPASPSGIRLLMGSPLPGGTVGIAYPTLTLAAAGGTTPYVWQVRDGALPPGLGLSGGAISGTPSAAGTYFFTLVATDSSTPISAAAYLPTKLVVLPAGSLSAPRISGPNGLIPPGTLSVAYPTGINALASGGSGPYTWSATGLPPGFSINASTGEITGTPLGLGLTGSLTARTVGELAMLVTVPATALGTPGYLRMAATTPSPGGGVSNEAQFQIFGPQPQIAAVVDSASFMQGTISPGQILTIFGSGLGPASLTLFNPASPAPQIPNALPTLAPSTSVTVNGTPAPVLYTSANQVSVVVPYAVTGPSADVVLSYSGLASQPFTVALAPTAPGIYTTDASGRGQGAILNFNASTGDYTLNSSATPAARGQVVVLYVSGMGATTSSVANTLIPTTPAVTPVAPVTVTIGGQSASIAGAASPPGSVPGLLQINVTVPSNAPVGTNVPVLVSIGGVDSQSGVTMAIR